MKILVVDDDPAILMVATMVLEELGGYEVVKATGGNEAVEIARAQHPDVILTDLIMSDIDGPEVLEKLRSYPETASIPVIFHTAKTEPSEVRQLMALGAAGVIGKPFDPTELASEIERILARRE